MLPLHDRFDPEPLPHWHRHLVGKGMMGRTEGGWRLALRPVSESQYHDSQLDDGHGLKRRDFPWRPPLHLRVRARFSHPAGAWRGTAGFGWWNAPLRGDVATLVGAGPQALWFFLASPPGNLAFTSGWPGHGWFAQSLDLSRWPLPLLGAGLLAMKVPPLRRLAQRLTPRLACAAEQPLPEMDLQAWHEYTIEWGEQVAVFGVDGAEVLRAPTPRGPLALILWVDNQWATLDLRGGRCAVGEEQWMEVEEVILDF